MTLHDRAPSMMMPALISGAGFGLLSGLPIVSVCCCLWMIAAGFVAAFLYSRSARTAGTEFRAGKGASLGALTAVFHTVSWLVVSVVTRLLVSADAQRAQIEEAIGNMEGQGMEPEAIEMAEKIADFMLSGAGLVVFAIVVLVIGLAFCVIGGLIGGSVFKVEPAPPASGATVPPADGV